MKEEKLRGVCQCGKEYSFLPEKTGKKLKCPGCGEIFVATPTGSAEPAVPATQESDGMQSEKVAVNCQCGKEYRFAPEKLGKKFKCSLCGEMFLAAVPAGGASAAQESAPAEGSAGQMPSRPATMPTSAPAVHLLTEGEEIAIDDSFAPVNPDDLLALLNKGKFSHTLCLATIAVGAVILLTSVPFIGTCIEFKTFYPKPIIAKNEKEAKEEIARRKKEEKTQKEQEEKRAKAEALAKKPEEGAKTDKSSDSKPQIGSPDEKKPNVAKPGEGTKELSPVEKRVTETSKERPKSSSVGLDDPEL